MSSLSTSKLVILAVALAGLVNGHSWVEQMQEISDDGSFVGPMGYPRGYIARTDSGFNGDAMNYLLPPLSSGRIKINDDDLLCHPNQRTQKQSNNYPALTIKPGGYMAMKYLENGHVTLPANQKGKAKSGGTVFVYGTSEPKDDEKIMDVLKWTEDGKGGDGRGKMIAAQNFDDGRCHQINGETISKDRQEQFPDRVPNQPTSNVEQWCETDVKLPSDVDGSKLTVYWVWQWNTEAGADPTYPDGKDEYYTTCADVKLGQSQGVGKNAAQMNTLQQQDPQTKAPEGFEDRTAYIKFPLSTGSGDDSSSSPPKTTSVSPPTSTEDATTTSSRTRTRTHTRNHESKSSPTTTATEESDAPASPTAIYITVTVTEKSSAATAPASRSRRLSNSDDDAGADIPRTTLLARARAAPVLSPEQLASEPRVSTDLGCEDMTSASESGSGGATATATGSLGRVSTTASESAATTTSSVDLSDGDKVSRAPRTLVTSTITGTVTATRSVPRVVVTTGVPGGSGGMIGREREEGVIGARGIEVEEEADVKDVVEGRVQAGEYMRKRESRRKLGASFPSLKELELKGLSTDSGWNSRGGHTWSVEERATV